MPRRMLILDYDLTLLNNYVDFYDAFSDSLRAFGLSPISFEEFMELLEGNALGETIPKGVEESFWRYFRRIYSSHCSCAREGALELLSALKSHSWINVVITGREMHRRAIEMELEMAGLRDFVDDVYTILDAHLLGLGEEYLFDKSSLIGYALRRHGVDPRNAICIGDFIADLISCSKYGIKFIGINDSEVRNEVLRKLGATYLVKNLREALGIILNSQG